MSDWMSTGSSIFENLLGFFEPLYELVNFVAIEVVFHVDSEFLSVIAETGQARLTARGHKVCEGRGLFHGYLYARVGVECQAVRRHPSRFSACSAHGGRLVPVLVQCSITASSCWLVGYPTRSKPDAPT